MIRKYFYLSGLPRSGNTLISCLLNQHPDISCNANSPLAETLYTLNLIKDNDPSIKNFPDHISYNNIIKPVIHNYYSNWDNPYIIDRGCWGTPENLDILKRYNPNEIKIIVLTRNILEVLSSFIKWSIENPNNFLDNYSNSIEEQCDFLMRDEGQISKQIISTYNLKREENKQYSFFISYDNLVTNTEKVLHHVYDFLNIPPYLHHDYNLIEDFSANGVIYDDSIYGDNLHKIKNDGIKKEIYKPEDYLPPAVIQKYKNLII